VQLGRASTEPRISPEQFADFQASWDKMCHLLTKLRSCWVADDPHVICGFDVDHRCAVRALKDQPPGSFLCRFSLSQPGNFVLVCKARHRSPRPALPVFVRILCCPCLHVVLRGPDRAITSSLCLVFL
jgi:SH2 domain